MHLHVLVEEVEEELVSTLVLFLDFVVFEVGAVVFVGQPNRLLCQFAFISFCNAVQK